jgi:RNA polymerase sigma-70 factor (ECF subfamily)
LFARIIDNDTRVSESNVFETGGLTQDGAASLEHLSGLYGYAMVLTHNRAEAEDLVQETYLRAIGAIGRLRPGSNVKPWLFTILRNIWLNQLRSRRARPPLAEIDGDEWTANSIVETSQDPHELYVSKTEREQVREAIRKLPADFREIIMLREYEGLSYQEIASVLDCPAGTVMSRLGRARSRLRTLLSDVLVTSKPGERPSEE